jgi:hypothetical protein
VLAQFPNKDYDGVRDHGQMGKQKIAQMAGEHMLCKMDIKYMCKYIDRTDRPLSKEMDKRKNLAGSIR